MKIQLRHSVEDIISMENLLDAWREFLKGKRKKRDVQEFSLCLMDNILALHHELANRTYRHGGYQAFTISDPKPRNIHKASVRDRLLHHAVYRVFYPFFDRIFISDSFSCRKRKGTYKALNRFRDFARKTGKNNTRTCWVLKCDIKKFFANIDHNILMSILAEYTTDNGILWLLKEVIDSFSSAKKGIGLPLGNLTSQLLVNIYMNEFDQFVKHRLRARYYIRYADDFVFLSEDQSSLKKRIPYIEDFLAQELRLKLHPDKVSIRTLSSGVDFLGWVHFSGYRILRTVTKKRMMKRIQKHPTLETLNSYLGLLKHGNTENLKRSLLGRFIDKQRIDDTM